MDSNLDLDLDAAAGLASLASDKGKPRASRKTVVLKPKKVLTAEQRAKESAKRKDRRHAAGARDEAIAAAAAQQQVTNACVAAATTEALCMLGLNPSQHGLVNAAVAAAVRTDSFAFPRAQLPDSRRVSSCNPVPGFHVYPQASRLVTARDQRPEDSPFYFRFRRVISFICRIIIASCRSSFLLRSCLGV
ncbi:putative serine/threonine-protein kinase [Hordeum vulgare]|nr:putative serine/threonine-protein kinase [Hordeum vulgare]